jgi:peptidyl-prolyl cis-trans isomerase B (cyclophilin B)
MFSIFILLAALASQPIAPMHTYNGIHNGIVVTVTLPESADVAGVALVDHKGTQITTPVLVTKGTHNILTRIPQIKKIESSVWLQMFIDGERVGDPLVIQPMESREVPIVEDAFRSDGKTSYAKIVGWKNEAEEDGVEGSFVSGWRVYVDQDVLIETSEGDIRVSLRPDEAPNTAWNFRELAKGGLYQNTTFHRIVPLSSKGHPFVIQGGDPTGTGMGGAGSWLPIENSALPHDFGVISMARAGDPDSAGCQFFLCLSREGTARLDGQYCSFGETVSGDEVIRAIALVPLADPASGEPVSPPIIHSISLIPTSPN